MENENLKRIKRISGKFRWLFSATIVFIPVLTFLFWAFFNYLPEGFTDDLPVKVTQILPYSTLILAFLVTLIPTSVSIYGLYTLRKLFTLYQQGIFFTAANVNCFRKLGYSAIAWVIANLLFTPLISVVLTFNNPPGERWVTVGIGSSDLATLIIGAVVVTISWVMNEASKLEDEQAHTV